MSGLITMKFMAERHLAVLLDDEQAISLWDEVKTELLKLGMDGTVREAEDSKSGDLDTYPRSEIMTVFAVIMTDFEDWPCMGTEKVTWTLFISWWRPSRSAATRQHDSDSPSKYNHHHKVFPWSFPVSSVSVPSRAYSWPA